ncbi:MAG: hypothetical protein BWX47_00319 [candidate division Hyd24-12 bacterium ADurb.Bin004]|nr:MAG: hypothetical protein BWX47_00319 [candidate division Hyd24-12 bacterium ADurb.Bin004]
MSEEARSSSHAARTAASTSPSAEPAAASAASLPAPADWILPSLSHPSNIDQVRLTPTFQVSFRCASSGSNSSSLQLHEALATRDGQ